MRLCSKCVKLDYRAIARSPAPAFHAQTIGLLEFLYVVASSAQDVEKRLTPFHTLPHNLHQTVSCCDLCEYVHNRHEEASKKLQTMGGFHQHLRSDLQLWLAGLNHRIGFQIIASPTEGKKKQGEPNHVRIGCLGYCVAYDNNLADAIPGRKVAASPTSVEVVRKIQSWLQNTESLVNAKQPCLYDNNFVPSRLLNIGSSGQETIHLTESPSHAGVLKYATLSHCWGSSVPVMLTRETLHLFRRAIRIAELPRSFQDAIALSRTLRISHLWIDSLCIIQDDCNDWEVQSSQMYDVYRESYLTIAASRSSDCCQGFMQTRPMRTYISIPYHDTASRREGTVSAFDIPCKFISQSHRIIDMEDEPLTNRGWTLQERYLARRIVHFGTSQIYLETTDSFTSEDGYRQCTSHGTGPFQLKFDMHEYGAWYAIVEKYSTRKLTFESDKLPAIGGIAAKFALEIDCQTKNTNSRSSCHYAAGLWSADLLNGFCWEGKGYPSEPLRRSQTYRAPSWSWAAFDGGIKYRRLTPNDELAVVKAVHVTTTAGDSNIRGSVTGGWVHLRALRIFPFKMTAFSRFWFREHGITFFTVPQFDVKSEYSYNILQEWVLESDISAIPLVWQENDIQSSYETGPILLLVVPANTPKRYTYQPHIQAYRRVGLGIAGISLQRNRRTDEPPDDAPADEAVARAGLAHLVEDIWKKQLEREDLEDIILV